MFGVCFKVLKQQGRGKTPIGECRCKACMKPVPSVAWVEWKASLDAFQSGKTIPEIQEWLGKNPAPI